MEGLAWIVAKLLPTLRCLARQEITGVVREASQQDDWSVVELSKMGAFRLQSLMVELWKAEPNHM